MSLARAQALRELRLFGLGLLAGVPFVLICLFTLRIAGFVAFAWAAVRVPYAIVIAYVVDAVLHEKPSHGPRALPVTAFTAGAVLPVALVSLRYFF